METQSNVRAKSFAIVALIFLVVELVVTNMGRYWSDTINILMPLCIFIGALGVFGFRWKDLRWEQPVFVYAALFFSLMVLLVRIIPSFVFIYPLALLAFAIWSSIKTWQTEKDNDRKVLSIFVLDITALLLLIHTRYLWISGVGDNAGVDAYPFFRGVVYGFLSSQTIITLLSVATIGVFVYRLIKNRQSQSSNNDNAIIAIACISYAVLTLISVNAFRYSVIGNYIKLILLLTANIVYEIYARKNTNSQQVLNSSIVLCCVTLFQWVLSIDPFPATIVLFAIALISWIYYGIKEYHLDEKIKNSLTNNPRAAGYVAVIAAVLIGAIVLLIRTSVLIQRASDDGFGVAGYRAVIIITAIILTIAIIYGILVAVGKVIIAGVDGRKTAKYANVIAVALFIISVGTSNIVLRAKYGALNDKINAEAQAREMERNRLNAQNRLKGNDLEDTHWKGYMVGVKSYFAFKENGIVLAEIGGKKRTGKYYQNGNRVTVAINGGEGNLNFTLRGGSLILWMSDGNRTEQYEFTQY